VWMPASSEADGSSCRTTTKLAGVHGSVNAAASGPARSELAHPPCVTLHQHRRRVQIPHLTHSALWVH